MTAGFVLQAPTRREAQVLAALKRLVRPQHQAPTRRELGTELGISAPTVELHLQRLQSKGHVQLFAQWRGVFPVGVPLAYRRTPRGLRAVLANTPQRRLS